MLLLPVLLVVAAAETDPYTPWLSPPRDSTASLNRVINAHLAHGLAKQKPAASCDDVRKAITAPLWSTAMAFFASEMRLWPVDTVGPGSFASRAPTSARRLVPVDPALRVGDVLFGTDKLGHFFSNGPRYLARYQALRARGATVAEAEAGVVQLGVAQENGAPGWGAAGAFSYADLAANWAGFSWLRGLCEDGGLVVTAGEDGKDGGRWSLARPFDITAFVDPCWDEAWAPSAFADDEAAWVERDVRALCPALHKPAPVERRRRYAAHACNARHQELLAQEQQTGAAPDPSAWSFATICGG